MSSIHRTLPQLQPFELGCSIDELDTPSLCLDLDILEDNIRSMANICRSAGVAWRPHSKGHKTPEIARRQIDAGAIGVTCAKLGEAEVMAAGGVEDILIANQVVGPRKMQRLVDLCRSARPIIAVDHPIQLEAMSAAADAGGVTVRVLIEVDIGLERAGVAPGEATVRLARQVVELPALVLEGIMGYEGHLLTVPDPDEKAQRIAACLDLLGETKAALQQAGLPCEIVSAGGTGSYKYTIRSPHVTELQAGGLIFMDAFYRHACQVSEFGNALTLLTTVVSRPAADRAIIDAGQKAHNKQIHEPEVIGHADIRVTRLSAEHGELALGAESRELRVGDRLQLIPGYGDFTTFLHDAFYVFRDGRLEAVWPLVARGRLD